MPQIVLSVGVFVFPKMCPPLKLLFSRFRQRGKVWLGFSERWSRCKHNEKKISSLSSIL